MEALYLLASLTTTLHSLLLLLRLLLPFPRRPAPGSGGAAAAAVRLYEGRVRHSRRRTAAHAFEYPVRYALVDLDCLPLPGHLSAADARRVASTSGPVISGRYRRAWGTSRTRSASTTSTTRQHKNKMETSTCALLRSQILLGARG